MQRSKILLRDKCDEVKTLLVENAMKKNSFEDKCNEVKFIGK